MNGTSTGAHSTKRWGSAAVVIGSTMAILASPLAIGSASAATLAITSGANSNHAVNGTTAAAPIVVTTSVPVSVTVNSGPDAVSPLVAFSGAQGGCTAPAAGSSTCTVKNVSGNAGTDSVIIFIDSDTSGTFSAGDTSVSTNATFSGPPTAVGIAPVRIPAAHTLTTEGTTCEVYSVSAFDTLHQPAAGRAIALNTSETVPLTTTANPFSYYTTIDANGFCAGAANPGVPLADTVPNPSPTTHTLNNFGSVTTGSDGTVKFGLVSSAPGSGAVEACYFANPFTPCTPSSPVSDTDTVTWAAGGPDSVASLVATPTSTSGYAGTTATYTVKAVDAGGNPIQGITVHEQEANGPSTTAPTSCSSPTDQNGNVTCTITSNGSGTVNETIWVDNGCTPPAAHTTGPDACEPQTSVASTFNALQTYTSHTMTCVQQLNNAQHGQDVSSNCTVPTSQHSIVFSETLKNNGAAVPGATISFSATSATLGGVVVSPANLPSGTAVTDANGVATFTVSNPSAADGDSVVVAAKIGATPLDSESGFWASAHATSLTLSPSVQSVTKGGVVSLNAKVVDQFGNGVTAPKSLSYLVVSGRNIGAVSGTATTDANGSATITYPDGGGSSSVMTDTINVNDTTDGLSGNATVTYVNGSTTASTVAVDSSGLATSDATCLPASHTAATNVALAGTTEVCAVVKNNFTTPEALAGKSVTFTVSNGQVAAHGGLVAASTTTYVATTDSNGVAFADVKSTKSGAQTVTATSDAASGTSTVTYASPTAASARNIAVAPTTATVSAGTQQKFTFTVTDQYGNGVGGVNVLVTQSGSGILSGGNVTVPTAADGTASVQLTTQATDTGTGSVAGSISAGGNQCAQPAGTPVGAMAGSCTAVATYTIGAPIVPKTLTVVAAPGARVGQEELVAATVKNSDNSPAVNQVVRFTISGANSASGSVVTNAKGVALFGFLPKHAGSTHVAAYDDINADSVREGNEPQGSLNVAVAKVTEKPTIKLTSASGTVTIHVTSHPKLANAKVTYYVKHHGNFTKIGSEKTGHLGKASQTFIEGKGVTYTFRAKVTGKSGVATGVSKSKSIKVKK